MPPCGVLPRALLVLFAALSTFSAEARAVTITFSAVDLADVNVGEDLYRYEYALDEFPFLADFSFSVFFDPALYASLQSPPPAVGSDWDIIAIQPDVNLPDDGIYDALALADNPSPLIGFSVEFVWLGTGAPGAQPFAINDDSFEVIQSGTTVPEPGSLGLLALGMTWFGLRRRSAGRSV